jgi:hypothetical protein
MNRRHLILTIVFVASAAWLGGCAAKADPATGEDAYWQRLGMSLKDSTQPREQALAAQMLDFRLMVANDGMQPAAGESAAHSATESAIRDLLAKVNRSDDAVALSIATQVGVKRQDQRVGSSAAVRWQEVEPGNFAPRLFVDTSIEAVLAGARDATRYESYGYDQVRLMTSVFQHLPMRQEEMGSGYSNALTDDEARAVVSAFAIWAAYANPAYQKLTRACRDEALLSTPTRRDDCLHVAQLMAEKSGYVLSRSIGISMLERAASTPEGIALATRLRRNNEWQRHQYFQVLMQAMDDQQQAGEMLRLLKTPGIDNEIQLMETALREKGIALVPPEDWQLPKRG